MLTFQRLDVYRCSIQFVTLALQIARKTPRSHAELKDQLRRAAISVPLNIAEGASRTSEADGARHYAIARGSAMECAALLDIIREFQTASDEEYAKGVELVGRLVAMLTRMCR